VESIVNAPVSRFMNHDQLQSESAGRFAPVSSTLAAASRRSDSSIAHSAAMATFGSFAYACRWSLPRPRKPTQATRTVSLGLEVRSLALLSTAAELMMKCLRFIIR
jgi:hypothetical protein